MASHHRNGDECTAEEDIEDYSDERKEWKATETERQHDGEDQIEACGARKTLNCLLPRRDADMVVMQPPEEVAVDAEDDATATKLDGIEESLEEFERCTSYTTHVGDSTGGRR